MWVVTQGADPGIFTGSRRCRTRLPKFKFLANFPIGLHVILQIQIKKNQKCLISYVKKYFNRKSIEVQH